MGRKESLIMPDLLNKNLSIEWETNILNLEKTFEDLSNAEFEKLGKTLENWQYAWVRAMQKRRVRSVGVKMA